MRDQGAQKLLTIEKASASCGPLLQTELGPLGAVATEGCMRETAPRQTGNKERIHPTSPFLPSGLQPVSASYCPSEI